MRKIDVLCNEKFNGNMPETLNYVVRNYDGKQLEDYVLELNPEENSFVSNVLYKMACEKHGEKNVINTIKENSTLAMLDLTKEEVQKAEKNPYKAKLGKNLLKLLVASGGIIALTTVMNNFDLGSAQSTLETLAIGGTTIYSTLTAMNVGVDLLKYFKFKKLKKQYNIENQQQNVDFQEQEGKVL